MPRALEISIDVTRIDRAVDSLRRLSTETRTLSGGGGGGGGGGGRGLIGPTRAEARAALNAGQQEAREAARESRHQFRIADTAKRQAEREFAQFSGGLLKP